MGTLFGKAGHRFVSAAAYTDATELTPLQIFEMFQTLFLHSLLPPRMLQMEDFLGGTTVIPLRKSPPARPPPRSDGLLSALSSYLMTPYSSSTEAIIPDATELDVENTLCTIDCITSCRLDELYAQTMWEQSMALHRINPDILPQAVGSRTSCSGRPRSGGNRA